MLFYVNPISVAISSITVYFTQASVVFTLTAALKNILYFTMKILYRKQRFNLHYYDIILDTSTKRTKILVMFSPLHWHEFSWFIITIYGKRIIQWQPDCHLRRRLDSSPSESSERESMISFSLFISTVQVKSVLKIRIHREWKSVPFNYCLCHWLYYKCRQHHSSQILKLLCRMIMICVCVVQVHD